jgi:hypothetical protein
VSDPVRPTERYMTVAEISDRMGIPADAILRFHAEGRITGRRMPGTVSAVLFLLSEVGLRQSARTGRGAGCYDRPGWIVREASRIGSTARSRRRGHRCMW